MWIQNNLKLIYIVYNLYIYYIIDYLQLYIEFKDKLIQPYLDDELKDDYKTYCFYGGCFWYNLTFCYTLAKLVYPNYKFEIACSSKHLTVVCHEHKLVFNILYNNI